MVKTQDNNQTATQGERESMGVILVAGATGGVGKRVVSRLLNRNYQVRALVRDTERATEMLGDKVELFEADIIIPETLTPQLMDNVSAVICCTGTRVQPVEGDTPNREKYYQGIKFYLPEVVDSPELVEYQGIKNLVQVVTKHLKASEKLTNPLSQFVMVSSAGVTRPGRPGLNLAEEPPAVRMNDQLGGLLTWKLRGEEVVKNSGITYTIVRPCALTEKPGNKALYFDQGDNIKGQVSRETIAELCIQAIEQPEACNKTFEVREEEQSPNSSIDWKALFGSLKPDQ